MNRLSYRPETLAEASGLSIVYIRRLIRDGKLEARKVGRAVVIPAAAAEALISGAPLVVANAS